MPIWKGEKTNTKVSKATKTKKTTRVIDFTIRSNFISRSKKRKLYNTRIKNPSHIADKLRKYRGLESTNLPKNTIDTYTPIDDGCSYRYKPENPINSWYYNWGPIRGTKQTLGANSYALTKERSELAKHKIFYELHGYNAVPCWGNERIQVCSIPFGALISF